MNIVFQNPYILFVIKLLKILFIKFIMLF